MSSLPVSPRVSAQPGHLSATQRRSLGERGHGVCRIVIQRHRNEGLHSTAWQSLTSLANQDFQDLCIVYYLPETSFFPLQSSLRVCPWKSIQGQPREKREMISVRRMKQGRRTQKRTMEKQSFGPSRTQAALGESKEKPATPPLFPRPAKCKSREITGALVKSSSSDVPSCCLPEPPRNTEGGRKKVICPGLWNWIFL